MKEMTRCSWPGANQLMIDYHDKEWGVPLHDDQKLFEFITLDAFQAGLSWSTILNKRENFRQAFDNFDPQIIRTYNEAKVSSLMQDAGIIRNHAKIIATINNANRFLEVQSQYGSFDKFIWSFVDGKPIVGYWKELGDIPTHTPQSDAMSKELKKLGFNFVGTTICYAFMQAAGLVNDHQVSCCRFGELTKQV